MPSNFCHDDRSNIGRFSKFLLTHLSANFSESVTVEYENWAISAIKVRFMDCIF